MANEAEEITDRFKTILLDARDSGPKVLRAWLSEPDRFLRETRYSLPIHEVLRGLSVEEQEKAMAVADYAVRSSFSYLLKYLEEGESGLTFTLTASDESTGAKECVIGDGVYSEFADFVR